MTSAKGAGVEPKIGQRLDDTLAVQLGDYHLDNLHEASSLGGFIGHVVPSASDPRPNGRHRVRLWKAYYDFLTSRHEIAG